jgi:hypothetical protein
MKLDEIIQNEVPSKLIVAHDLEAGQFLLWEGEYHLVVAVTGTYKKYFVFLHARRDSIGIRGTEKVWVKYL